ncbi:uncharacterized protein LOC133800398 [Humulus lupulus]|uniref:uncharacterized protein LOC133800398 n=1 Tax=Humulus lupulus TaxID=3486 RepID=UPI002B412214|nr:uncharacterized protein LOC133800398 [Humulus lupulus]
MENYNLMSWNVRGINKKNKQMLVLDVCRMNKIGIGALLERKIKGDKLKEFMETSFLGWNYYNSMRVRFCITGQEFCLTVVYGSNQLETRKELWFELANLPLPVKPWLIVGDFNAMFDPNDRKGGRSVTKKEIVDARNWLDLGLVEEMKIMGSFYTWSNNQDGVNRIYSKLDRIFCNEGWLDVFLTVTATTHWEVTSDHSVILLKQTGILKEGISPFRFYNMWIAHPQFRVTVLTNWNKTLRTKGRDLDQISWKLLRLKHELKKFNWRIVGDVVRKYEDSKADYQKTKSNLFNDPQNQSLCSAERASFLRFKRQEKIYGSFLRQKSKIDWLQFGDENSSYFHAHMKQRKKANRIASYVTEDGRVEDN